MKRNLLFILLMAGLPFGAQAEKDPTLSVSAPKFVLLRAPFEVKFTATYYTESDSLRTFYNPAFPDFELLAGPMRSTNISMSFTKGQEEKTFSIILRYSLVAQDTGTFAIPAATALLGDKLLASAPSQIHVLPPGEALPQDSIDIFIKPVLSSSSCKINMPIVLELQLWTTVMIDSIGNERVQVCDPKDFDLENIDLQGTQWKKAEFKHRDYNYCSIGKYVLYPLRTGKLQTKSIPLTVFYRSPAKNGGGSVWDIFFDSYTRKKREIVFPPQTILVEP